jgi:hypothetical protein
MTAVKRSSTKRLMAVGLLAVTFAVVGILQWSKTSGHARAAVVPTLVGVTNKQLQGVNIVLSPPSGTSPKITSDQAVAVAEDSWDGNKAVDAKQATCTIPGSDIAENRPCWVVVTDPGDDDITVWPNTWDSVPEPKVYPVTFQVTLVDASSGDLIWAQEGSS